VAPVPTFCPLPLVQRTPQGIRNNCPSASPLGGLEHVGAVRTPPHFRTLKVDHSGANLSPTLRVAPFNFEGGPSSPAGPRRGSSWAAAVLQWGRCGAPSGPIQCPSWAAVRLQLGHCGAPAGPLRRPSWAAARLQLGRCGAPAGPLWGSSWAAAALQLRHCSAPAGPLRRSSWATAAPQLGRCGAPAGRFCSGPLPRGRGPG